MSKWFNFKKYLWFNADLEKKYKRNNYIVYALAVLALISLYGLPGNLKMISMVLLIVGAYFIFKGTGIQGQDKQLKVAEQLRRQQKLAEAQDKKV